MTKSLIALHQVKLKGDSCQNSDMDSRTDTITFSVLSKYLQSSCHMPGTGSQMSKQDVDSREFKNRIPFLRKIDIMLVYQLNFYLR